MSSDPALAKCGVTIEAAVLDLASATLRSLGLRLLRELLNGGRGLPAWKWFSRLEAKPLGRSRWWRIRRWRSNLWAWLTREASPHHDRDRFCRNRFERLAFDRQLREGYAVPDRLWALAGTAAWTSPDFQATSAAILVSHMCTRLIVGATDFPVPDLRPEALWLIIATAPARYWALTYLLPSGRRSRRAIARIRLIATTLALNGFRADNIAEWANDLWGQWVAWHIWRAQDLRRLSQAFPGLQSLPLISGVADSSRNEYLERARVLVGVYDRWYPGNQGGKRV